MNKSIRSLTVTIIVAFFPVILWLIVNSESLIEDNYLLTISKLFALAGFSLYGWSVILSSRANILVKLYGGLINLYKWHHLIGIAALVLLLTHPTIVLLRYLSISFESLLTYIAPSLDLPKLAGMLTLSILFIGVISSIYLKIKHETFIKIHAIMGIVFFLGAYHAFLMPTSDLLDSVILTAYATAWIMLAAFVVLYRSILRRSFNPSYEYFVQNIDNKNDYIKLTIRPKKEKIYPQPGQFVFLRPLTKNIPNQSHPFSVLSSYKSGSLTFLIKKFGDFTKNLDQLKIGDVIMVDGPWGDFASNLNLSPNQIWIAGGIGVTPFLSMASNLVNQEVIMYYSVKSIEHAYLENEFNTIAQKNKNFKIYLIDTSKAKEINIDDISKINSFKDSSFWICGPPSMVVYFKKELKLKGIKSKNINTEEFKLS